MTLVSVNATDRTGGSTSIRCEGHGGENWTSWTTKMEEKYGGEHSA